MLDQNENREQTKEQQSGIDEELMDGLRILARLIARRVLEARKPTADSRPVEIEEDAMAAQV